MNCKMLIKEMACENFRENKRNFSVNIITTTENGESTNEPSQFNPPLGSLALMQKKRYNTFVSDEAFYHEKLKALSKIKDLQKQASELNSKINLHDVDSIEPSDDDFIKKTGEKVLMAKRKRGRGCNCNQSCVLF